MRLLGPIVHPAVVVERAQLAPLAAAYPQERALVAAAVPQRQREFATGRVAAREALSGLGLPPVALPIAAGGGPAWPTGVVGSITHCRGYVAAAVARAGELAAIGIDAEPHIELPDDVAALALSADEQRDVRDLGARGVGSPALLACVAFAAKEAVYKAWTTITGQFLDFDEATLTLHPAHCSFEAVLDPRRPGPHRLSGRYRVGHGLVVTAVLVPMLASPAPPGPTGAHPIAAEGSPTEDSP